MNIQIPELITLNPTLEILLIDDDEDEFLLVRGMLNAINRTKYSLSWAASFDAGKEALRTKLYHAVLVDYDLGTQSGIQLIREMSETEYHTPFILYTGRGNFDVDVEAMQAGASLYLTKGEVTPLLLERSIRYARELKQKEGELQRAGERLEQELAERKQVEETIAHLVERFNLAARAAHLGVWDWNIVDDQVVWDDQMYVLYGGNKEPVSGVYYEAWLNRLHPEDRAASEEITKQALRGEIEYDTEFRVIWPDGSTHWIKSIAQVIRDENGQPLRMVGVNFDITEQKLTESTIRQQASRLKVLSDASLAFSSVVSNYQAVLEQVVHQIAEVFGDNCHIRLVSEDQKWLELAAIYDPDPIALETARAMLTQVPMSTEGDRIGSRVFQSGQPMWFPILTSEHLRMAVTPEIQAVIDRFNPHSIITIPLRIHENSIGLLNLARYQQGKPPYNESDFAFVQELAASATLAISNARLFQQAQTELNARTRAEQALQIERDSLAYRVEERTAQLSLANAELTHANRAKDEFLSTMSHELRTPLNAILSLSESIQEGTYGELNTRQKERLDIIHESGNHLLEMITDILDLSKIEAGHMQLRPKPVDIEALSQACLRMIRQQAYNKHLKISASLAVDAGTVAMDERRLKQMVINLLSNAIKFTPEGGQIGLEVVREQGGDALRFIVWDTGIGISAEKIGSLFEPFIQLDSALNRQYEGTGLGLVLVRRMAEQMGGSVGVESEPGKGSRFWFIIPAVEVLDVEQQARLAGENRMAPQRAPLVEKKGLILIAEDNFTNLEGFREYLQAKGYRILSAGNGYEAIERAQEFKPDLILMDIQMPAMDGLEATRRLRASAEFAATPIIALTALAMPGDRQRCLEAGVNEYLTKPISLRVLLSTIETLLG